MSWSIEERIGECRPFPAQVVVYRGETDECMAYVSGEVADRLKAENYRLRELLQDVAICACGRYCYGCPHQYDGCDRDKRLRAEGIEVDE